MVQGYSELEKLEKVVEKGNDVLFRATSLFPFELFPDEVIIEKNKVDFTFNEFFMTAKYVSTPIATINHAAAVTTPFFGSLSLEIEGDNENPKTVCHLSIPDAMRAAHIINGLIICNKERVDLTNINNTVVRAKVEEIGKTLQ